MQKQLSKLLFPLVQLPKKFKGRCGIVNEKPEFNFVSISSTSEEVQSGNVEKGLIAGGFGFPLVQLPKKFKVESAKQFESIMLLDVSISSTSEEVQSLNKDIFFTKG